MQLKRSRPNMASYGINADEKGLLEWDWVSTRMKAARNYWISTTRPDGKPHAAPVWGVWMDEALYFGTSPTSRKGRNIAHQPYVVVHLESGDEVVICEGTLTRETNSAILHKMADIYGKKYPHQPDPENEPDGAYYVLRPEKVMAWIESDYPNTATNWSNT